MYVGNLSCWCSKKKGNSIDGVDIPKTSHNKSYANEGFKKWVSREYKIPLQSHVIETNEFFPHKSN